MPKSEVELESQDVCTNACFEGDPSSVQTHESYHYAGAYKGEYSQETAHVFVGSGRGDWEREVRTTYGSWRVRVPCLLLLGALLMGLGFLAWYFWPRPAPGNDEPAANPINCYEGYHDWENLWDANKQAYCCDAFGRACPHYKPQRDVIYKQVGYPVPMPAHHHYVSVPVPSPQHVVYKARYVHLPPPAPAHVIHHFKYNCRAGFSNWYFGWSHHKKAWCCSHASRGCPGTWHGSYHLHMHVEHGVGHAHGRIYDCDAGFSNWMQGWSDSKKDWCCSHEHRGCVKYHCTGHALDWHPAKKDWCCAHFQKGCPQTTLSPLKCDTPCEIKGETETCLDRIKWTADNVFGGKDDKCQLAYSKVQVECDVCRSCSIQEAGCEVHDAGSLPFDCNAALNNFFRAWSPEKKHWCCTKQGKGCEGKAPPAVDAGYGMVWKHVQVNGYWTWVAVHGHGHFSLPYDCHAGLANWHTGWSVGKKGWCCSHQHLGCDGGAGGGHVVVVHQGGGGGGGGGGAFHNHAHPPSAAGHGMMWHWSSAGGGHWVQVGMHSHLPFDCLAGVSNWRAGWSQPKKVWCCQHFGNSCA